MIAPFRNFSLSNKILSVTMVTCSGALILACAVIMVYDLLLYREDMSQQLSVQADIIGANSTMALVQQDREIASQTLQALRYQPGITKAIIYAKDGAPFATFYPSLSNSAPVLSHIEDFGFDFLTLSLVREIMDRGNRIGTIVIQATLDEVQQRWMAFATIVAGVIFASSLFAFLLSNRLQALISDPILRLTSLAQRVSSEKNYSLRETKDSQDEIGTLIDGMNGMLDQIQDRDRQLHKYQEELEELVNHRTAELSELHRQVELILDTAGEGIIGLDQQGRAKFVNAAAFRMLGWTAKELQGQSLHNFIHRNDSEESPYPTTEYAPQKIAGEGMAPPDVHDVFWRKDGTSFPVEYTSAPIRDEAGLVTGFVMTFRDITEQKQFEAALFEAVQSAEKANEAKSRFLANMSHEIRTPMNGLLGMTELLLKTQQTPKQRQFSEFLHRSGTHLLRIINDILDFSKIEARKLELEILEFPLHQMIEDTVQLFAEPAQKKGLELICHIEATVPPMAQGDPGRLRQILTNLIGNAIKFTTQGEVYLRASVAQDQQHEFELHVEVLDTGIGIPADTQSKIFEAFSQADGSTTRKFGGTGLGLTITKQLAELMGGQIHVSSEEEKGSIFFFSAPLSKASSSDLSHENVLHVKDFQILLVEDNHRNQFVLKELFTKWGIPVQHATNGAQALTLLDQGNIQGQHLNAMFIDQTLPDMDGISLAERIQANPAMSEIPLILLTPWHMTEEEIHRASQAGLHRQILKPIREADLHEHIRALAETPQSTRDASHPLATSPIQNNLGSASVLLAEDHQVNQEIVKAMADHLGLHLEIANNGIEAIKALAQQSYDLVLMDWQMPELDGLSATLEIREHGVQGRHQTHLPIIAITAHASAQGHKTCLDAGTDDVLPKPFTLEQLKSKLKQWLPPSLLSKASAPRRQDSPHSPSPSISAPSMDGDILDPAALAQIRSLQRPNAPNIVDKVIDQYVHHTPKLLADLQEGLRQADASLLHHTAHTLKSSSANMGAMRLSEACKKLEHLARSSQYTDDMESLIDDITMEYETLKPILATHYTKEHP